MRSPASIRSAKAASRSTERISRGSMPSERARRGVAYVPQGREIFPLLTVEENLKTGFAPLKREERTIPHDVFSLFPVLDGMLRRRGGDLSGGQQQQLAIGRALVMRPRLLLLDEPTEGIQPSIIKDIGRAIAYLRNLGQIAVVLVEQYLDFARELGDYFAVMERGAIVYSCTRETWTRRRSTAPWRFDCVVPMHERGDGCLGRNICGQPGGRADYSFSASRRA